jgi:hypothetical protein
MKYFYMSFAGYEPSRADPEFSKRGFLFGKPTPTLHFSLE